MFIEKQKDTINACRFCFMCRHICPVGVATCRESDTPRGKALMLSRILNGSAKFDEDIVDAIYRDALDGTAHVWCKGNFTPHLAALAARQDIVSLGIEPPAVRNIAKSIEQHGNPLGRDRSQRFAEIDTSDLFNKQAEVLYFAGCDACYLQPEIPNAFISIMRNAGLDFTMLADESSSGKPLLLLGYQSQPRLIAQEIAAKIRATGCRKLIVASPSDYDAFRNDYPAMGIDLEDVEILQTSQYLARLLSEGGIKLNASIEAPATFLDSDMLCRHNGISSEPRQLLAKIFGDNLREMRQTKELACSCGEAGGLMRILHPAVAGKMAERIIQQAKAVGAGTIVTTCPTAKRTITETDTNRLAICDLVEIIARVSMN